MRFSKPNQFHAPRVHGSEYGLLQVSDPGSLVGEEWREWVAVPHVL